MAPKQTDICITPVQMKCRRGCPDRTYDCHSKCEKYAAYRAECDKEIQRRTLERDVDSAVCDAVKRLPWKRGI